jgi:hypothetical protein
MAWAVGGQNRRAHNIAPVGESSLRMTDSAEVIEVARASQGDETLDRWRNGDPFRYASSAFKLKAYPPHARWMLVETWSGKSFR